MSGINTELVYHCLLVYNLPTSTQCVMVLGGINNALSVEILSTAEQL